MEFGQHRSDFVSRMFLDAGAEGKMLARPGEDHELLVRCTHYIFYLDKELVHHPSTENVAWSRPQHDLRYLAIIKLVYLDQGVSHFDESLGNTLSINSSV